jgi:hypothetical protein
MKKFKITNYILVAIVVVFLFHLGKNFLPKSSSSGDEKTVVKKQKQDTVLYNEQFIIEDKGIYKKTPFVVRKGKFMEEPLIIKGYAKVAYIIPEDEKNHTLWVKMATESTGLENTVPKKMTVNGFNSMKTICRYFSITLPPGSEFEQVKFNLYIKDKT